jgi:alpha-L-rhamnosidase
MKEIRPVSVSEPVAGTWVVDMGQNITGWCRLRLREPRGKIVSLKHGERLQSNGRLYTANLRSARQIDTYIARGGAEETWEPRFTYHGFQYVEIQGLSRSPAPEDVTGRAIWSSCPEAGRFECSSSLLNKLMSNILWTQRNNMTGIPTDCPQRDERTGWAGDIQLFSQTSIFNMDMEAFLGKWLQDMADDQAADGRFPDFAPNPFDTEQRFSGAPAWADAGVIVSWRLYQNYGNREILARMFEPCERWVRWVASRNPDCLWRNGRNNDYGDWLNADTFALSQFPKGRAEMPKEVFATVYFFRSASLLSRIAGVLGDREKEAAYADLAGRIKTAFFAAYMDDQGRIKGDTQAGYALALDVGILPADREDAALRHLLRCLDEFGGHLSTGIHATVPAMRQLTRFGHVERAYALAEMTVFPSWGYTIAQGGTTIWERWDGWTEQGGFQNPGMNSFCHYAIGAVGEWIYSTILGITPRDDAPGYREFDLRPVPGGSLTFARGAYRSVRGEIGVEWTREADVFTLAASVPENTRARIWVRTDDPSSVACSNPAEADILRDAPGFRVFSAGGGRYRFTSRLATKR